MHLNSIHAIYKKRLLRSHVNGHVVPAQQFQQLQRTARPLLDRYVARNDREANDVQLERV